MKFDSFCKICNDVSSCVKKKRFMRVCPMRIGFEVYTDLQYSNSTIYLDRFMIQ